MNTTTPYEKLIAEKLEQVPVPDMADSIWASIEMQLDVAPDAPDNTSTPEKAIKHKGKGWYGAAGAATVAVAVSLWWFSHKEQPLQKITPVQPAPTIRIPVTVPDSTSDKPAETKPAVPLIRPKDTVSIIDILPALPDFDSTAQQTLPAAKPDSQALKYHHVLPPVPDAVTTPPPKKSRGVKGITEDDYRLSVEDSTHKKQ